MSGVSIYQPGFCPSDPGSFRAIAGVTARKGPDDATVANETAQRLVQLAYTVDGKPPQVQFSPPTPIQIHGGRGASQVVATVTHPAPGPCDSPTVQVNIMATNGDGQTSVVFISSPTSRSPEHCRCRPCSRWRAPCGPTAERPRLNTPGPVADTDGPRSGQHESPRLVH
ncbi:hypothetical protein ACFQ0O_29810 [Saccharopolyspora spinosporotrichia]